VLAIPTFNNVEKSNIIVPFSNKKPLKVIKTKYNVLAVAICNIFRALEFIQLGPMPWEEILFNGIEDEHKKKD